MRVQLKARRQETQDVISFIFDLRGRRLEFQPGQYMFYQLDALAYPDERGNRRHFSISSAPSEKDILMFTTRIRGSGFKETLRAAPLGYELTCDGPAGGFILPPEDIIGHVFIAGGIGITPFRSIVLNALHLGRPLRSVMFAMNQSPGSIIFRSELEAAAARLPGFSLVPVVIEPGASWTGETGFLTEALLRKYVEDPALRLFWLSGPPAMIKAYSTLLQSIGIGEERIRVERFLGY